MNMVKNFIILYLFLQIIVTTLQESFQLHVKQVNEITPCLNANIVNSCFTSMQPSIDELPSIFTKMHDNANLFQKSRRNV